MWRQAEQVHLLITLEGLLAEKERVKLDDDDDSDPPPASETARAVEQSSEAVQLVQQALEQLGFGAPDQAPQAKAKAKAKSPTAPTPPPAQPPEPPTQGAPPAADRSAKERLRQALMSRGGVMESTELQKMLPGLKKKEIESLGFEVIAIDQSGRFKVCLRQSQQATPDASQHGAASRSGKQDKGKNAGKSGAGKGSGADGGKNGASKGGRSEGGKNGASKNSNAQGGCSGTFHASSQPQQQQSVLQQQQQHQQQLLWQQQQQQWWLQQQASGWQGKGGYDLGTYAQSQQQSPWTQQEGLELLRYVQGGARMQ